ncbi:mobile element protein [Streptomyces sp. NL15-2K]|nr:mobile element protein [Streptomyces sp. NL15-2K]
MARWRCSPRYAVPHTLDLSVKRLGYLSPIEFEEKHYADQAAAEPVNLKPRQPALTC